MPHFRYKFVSRLLLWLQSLKVIILRLYVIMYIQYHVSNFNKVILGGISNEMDI